jgi:hypothetical protein
MQGFHIFSSEFAVQTGDAKGQRERTFRSRWPNGANEKVFRGVYYLMWTPTVLAGRPSTVNHKSTSPRPAAHLLVRAGLLARSGNAMGRIAKGFIRARLTA